MDATGFIVIVVCFVVGYAAVTYLSQVMRDARELDNKPRGPGSDGDGPHGSARPGKGQPGSRPRDSGSGEP